MFRFSPRRGQVPQQEEESTEAPGRNVAAHRSMVDDAFNLFFAGYTGITTQAWDDIKGSGSLSLPTGLTASGELKLIRQALAAPPFAVAWPPETGRKSVKIPSVQTRPQNALKILKKNIASLPPPA